MQEMHFGLAFIFDSGSEHIPASLQRSEVPPYERQPWRRPLAYYYLHVQLTAPWEAHSLLAEVPAASTTGMLQSKPAVVSPVCRCGCEPGIRLTVCCCHMGVSYHKAGCRQT